MSRQTRRADIAEFRREAARGTVSYLVEPSDERLDGEPLLRNAIQRWVAAVAVRKPRCFVCRTIFANDGPQLGAVLLVTTSSAPPLCTVSGLCKRCWSDRSDEEIERAAAKVLRPVMPNGVG